MELIIDLPVRFRRFEREDFIALFPRPFYQRDAIALVLRLSIRLLDFVSVVAFARVTLLSFFTPPADSEIAAY